MELAGAVWRNLLGARGVRGRAYPPTASASGSSSIFETPAPTTSRRAVNLVGGLLEDPAKVDKRGLDISRLLPISFQWGEELAYAGAPPTFDN